MPYSVSLIIGRDGSTSTHVHDLMGCHTLARTKPRALAKLRVEIPEYIGWLRTRREDTRMISGGRIRIAEEVHVADNAGRAGGPDPLFKCDRTTATSTEIRRCLRLLGYTRRDLMSLVGPLYGRVLGWKPEGEPRSVRNTVRHIAQVDIWYLSQIGAGPRLDQAKMKDVLIFLEYARSLVNEQLPSLTTAQRKRIFYPRKWSDAAYPWTATKVLHRLVSQERQHTRYLRRILSLPSSPLILSAD